MESDNEVTINEDINAWQTKNAMDWFSHLKE